MPSDNIQTIFLWLLCILIIIVIIIIYVKTRQLIKNHGEQLKLIIQKEGYKTNKEGYAVIPSQLYSYASRFNKTPNQMLPTAQAEAWVKDSLPPTLVINNDRYGPQPWLQSNYDGVLGSNIGTASVADNKTLELGPNSAPLSLPVDGVNNEISGLANPNLDTSHAEPSALNVSKEELIKSGANAISGLSYNNNAPPIAEGPVKVQTGVNPEGFAAKEMFTMNTRACPPTVATEHFMVNKKNSMNNISTNREGYRPRRRYE